MGDWRQIFAIGFLLSFGCADIAGANQEHENRPDGIYRVGADDADMNAAKARAIATLPKFYSRFANPTANDSDFMIKFDIVPGEAAEYVWATDLDRSTTPMTGILENQPEETTHQIGDRVPIPESSIIDWMYRRGRVMQGGFTVRVLLDRMSPEDAAAERQHLGW